MADLDSTRIRYTKRWLCYFDLLGFTHLVHSKSIEHVLPLYEKSLSRIETSSKDKTLKGISFSWFSDTFIIFSRSGSALDFSLIEQAGRLFFQALILDKIPVRGALTYGDLYSQQERNIFIGPALIDAYNYGEGQNWLGFLLTPSAIKQLETVGLPVENRAFYRRIPNHEILKPGINGPVYAFAFNNGEVCGKNPYLSALKAMCAASDQEYKPKYIRAIEFLHMHHVKRNPNGADPA